MPKIDVAVPCYQYGRYLRDCVTSITRQDVPDMRVLIIDNGSTDDSLEVAQELARGDGRITVLHQPRNLGQKYAYNAAIDWADSDYLAILDADDVLAEGALSRAVSVMDSAPSLAFCHGPDYAAPFEVGSPPPLPAPGAHAHWQFEIRSGIHSAGLSAANQPCWRNWHRGADRGAEEGGLLQPRFGAYRRLRSLVATGAPGECCSNGDGAGHPQSASRATDQVL